MSVPFFPPSCKVKKQKTAGFAYTAALSRSEKTYTRRQDNAPTGIFC